MKKISFVIPCYGSEKTIRIVTDEIDKLLAENEKYDYEIIAVNDKSPDNVWQVLNEISNKNPRLKLINLAKNMNRPGAVMAGLSVVSGEYIVIMDDDGQCPIDNLWKLISELEKGHDVAMAKYTEYKQSIFKSFGTLVNRKMTEIIIEKPKDLNFTNFMAIKRYVIEEIKKYKNPYPYLTGLLLRTTSDIVNVEMEERKRIAGNTNFTLRKMIHLWLNGFTAFSVKPLRLSAIIGFLIALFGFIYGIYIVIYKVFINPEIVQGYSSLMSAFLFVSGIIMIMLGIIGEYIGRIYISINNSPQFVIKETKNIEDKREE